MMTLLGAIFYLLAGITLIATALAITRRQLVHAVVYLTVSFFSLAPIFYLLGAPFLALLEIIIYAGAIMILFLFIIMMLRLPPSGQTLAVYARQWWPAIILASISMVITIWFFLNEPLGQLPLAPAMATPKSFGLFLFRAYWFPVEIASVILFGALVGALYLGRREKNPDQASTEERT
jgi:NADH-quinone oxidoreductase subunit J